MPTGTHVVGRPKYLEFRDSLFSDVSFFLSRLAEICSHLPESRYVNLPLGLHNPLKPTVAKASCARPG